MSFWNYLESIRQKPEPARQAIAFVFAIIITAIIVTVWLYLKNISSRLVPITDTSSPFEVLWNYINDLWE